MSAGFGFTNVEASGNYAITVSDQIDYEISFWFQVPTTDPTFELSVNCFDCLLQTEFIPIDIRSGASNRIFIPGNLPICSLPNQWNFLHSVLYSSKQIVQNGVLPITSHAAGTNLIMQKGTAKIFVNLICAQNCLLVYDFKVKPLRTPFSTCFLQSNGLLEIWRKNNKKAMSATQIDAITQQFLVPYDTSISVIEL